VGGAYRQRFDPNILAVVHLDVTYKTFTFAGRRLKSDDPSCRTNPNGSEQRVEAMMRTNIKDSHSLSEKARYEGSFSILECPKSELAV
jgi:hypothetical protein